MDLSFNNAATSAARYAFGTHDRVTIQGEEYRPHSFNEEGWLMSSVDGNGLYVQFTHEKLKALGAAGRIRREPGYYDPQKAARRHVSETNSLSGLDEKARALHGRRSAYVAAFRELHREGKIKATPESITANSGELLKRASRLAGDKPWSGARFGKSWDFFEIPSERTLRRWLREENAHGESGLVGRTHRRGNRNRLMGPEEQALMMKAVRKYESDSRPTQKQIHDDVVIEFEDRNVERKAAGQPPLVIPSRETVRRAIHSLDPFMVMAGRQGLDAARKAFAPAAGGLKLTRPGERVEIDEHTIDLITLMHSEGLEHLLQDKELLSLGLDNSKARWTLTVALCATTRCILGMVISRNPKSSAAIQVLQMIMSDKGQFSDAVGGLGRWDMHLPPELIVTDNGLAFRSEDFRIACADLGISLEHTILATPEQRGKVERFFGTLARGLVPRLTGRTFSDVVTKGDAKPKDRAALTLEDFTFALVRWIVGIYHNTPHGGLGGETPLQCWRRLEAEYGVSPPPDNSRLRLVFGQKLERALTKEGVTVLGLKYHSERLALWMNRNGQQKLDVRWHPRDIGAVLVRLGKDWVEVPAIDPMMEGKAAQTWLIAWRKLKSAHPKKRDFDLETVHAAMKAIDERNATAMAMAGLLVNEWTEERIAHEERAIFQGTFVRERQQPMPAADGLGRSIPTLDNSHEASSPATRTRKTATAAQPERKSGVGFEE